MPPTLQNRSEEHTSELQSHRDLHSFPTRRSSDLPPSAAVYPTPPVTIIPHVSIPTPPASIVNAPNTTEQTAVETESLTKALAATPKLIEPLKLPTSVSAVFAQSLPTVQASYTLSNRLTPSKAIPT